MADSPAVSAAEPVSADDELAACCPDLDQWPTSWMYEPRDLSPGRQMVECFKPFLRHLLTLALSRKTLCQHRDHLWLLGGELIRDLHQAPRLRKRPIDQVVRPRRRRRSAALFRCHLPKVLSLPQGPQQFIESRAVDIWTTPKKRCPHAHSPNKCKCQCQPRDNLDQEAAPPFPSSVTSLTTASCPQIPPRRQ